MKVLRENKESLMAVLEAFVHDPLIGWRLFTPNDGREDKATHAISRDKSKSQIYNKF